MGKFMIMQITITWVRTDFQECYDACPPSSHTHMAVLICVQGSTRCHQGRKILKTQATFLEDRKDDSVSGEKRHEKFTNITRALRYNTSLWRDPGPPFSPQ